MIHALVKLLTTITIISDWGQLEKNPGYVGRYYTMLGKTMYAYGGKREISKIMVVTIYRMTGL